MHINNILASLRKSNEAEQATVKTFKDWVAYSAMLSKWELQQITIADFLCHPCEIDAELAQYITNIAPVVFSEMQSMRFAVDESVDGGLPKTFNSAIMQSGLKLRGYNSAFELRLTILSTHNRIYFIGALPAFSHPEKNKSN
jgi:hypothetical protein